MRYLAVPAIALICFISSPAFAQWTQPEGSQYSKVWMRSAIGSSAHALAGEKIETEAYKQFSLRVYNEYGLRDDLTLVTYAVPVGYASYGDDESTRQSQAYIGPIKTGLRYALLSGPLKLALSAHAAYSSEYFENNLAPDTVDYHYTPVVGTWEGGAEIQVGYGFSRYWTQGRLGMNIYSNSSISPAITAHFQFGANLRPDLQLNFRSFTLWPIEDVVETNVSGAGQTRYISVGFGLSWWFQKNLAISVGVDGARLEESNASTPTPTLGIEWKS